MKKSLVLTSVLSLVACSGGTGVSGDLASGYQPGDIIRAGTTGTVTQQAAESNSNVTSMVSEIGIATDGTTIKIGDTNRTATNIFVYGGKEFKSYRLDGVHFETGPVNGELREDMYITFGIDENTGKIDSIVYHDGDSVYENARKDNTNIFVENVYKYQLGSYRSDSYDEKPTNKAQVYKDIQDMLADNPTAQAYYLGLFDELGDDWDNDEHWVQETHNTTYELKGKTLNKKLRYSDFGYSTMTTVGEEYEPDYSVISGGYDIKKIDLSQPIFANKKYSFSGTAIGAKSYSDGEDYISEKISTNNGSAHLDFVNGQETLVMPFNNYYTVTVNKNGNNSNIAFTDYKGSNNNYKFTKETGITTGSTDCAFVNIKYFGDNNKPSEVVGTVHYEEHSGRYPGFSSAFGMTKSK